MCDQCWIDKGSPSLETPKVQALAEFIDEFYLTYAAGGWFHIVLDDWNIDADSVRWCTEQGYEFDALHERMAELLLDATEEEIGSALVYRGNQR